MKVDEARANERTTVAASTLAVYAEFEKNSPPGFWAKYRDNIRQSILDSSAATVLVAREADTIKGSVLLCRPNSGAVANHLPEMRLLAVPSEFRNLGIAGLLIDECERRSASSGGITLHTTALMQTAKAMYERRGYERYPDIDFEPIPGFVVWGYKKMLTNAALALNI